MRDLFAKHICHRRPDKQTDASEREEKITYTQTGACEQMLRFTFAVDVSIDVLCVLVNDAGFYAERSGPRPTCAEVRRLLCLRRRYVIRVL